MATFNKKESREERRGWKESEKLKDYVIKKKNKNYPFKNAELKEK